MKLGKSEVRVSISCWQGVEGYQEIFSNQKEWWQLGQSPGVTNQNTKYLFRMKNSEENSRFKVLLKVTLWHSDREITLKDQ